MPSRPESLLGAFLGKEYQEARHSLAVENAQKPFLDKNILSRIKAESSYLKKDEVRVMTVRKAAIGGALGAVVGGVIGGFSTEVNDRRDFIFDFPKNMGKGALTGAVLGEVAALTSGCTVAEVSRETVEGSEALQATPTLADVFPEETEAVEDATLEENGGGDESEATAIPENAIEAQAVDEVGDIPVEATARPATEWVPPTLEQAVSGRGGETPETLRGFEIVIEEGMAAAGMPAEVNGFVSNTKSGEAYRWAAEVRAVGGEQNGQLLWAQHLNGEYGVRPNVFRLQQEIINGQEVAFYALETEAVEYVAIPDSEETYIRFTGENDEIAVPMRNPEMIGMPDGSEQNLFTEYFDFESEEWKKIPEVAELMRTYYTSEEAEELAGMEAVNPEEYGDFVWGNPDVNLQIQQTDASKREIGDLQFNKEEPNALINLRILEFMTQEVGRIFGYDSAEAYSAAREAGEVRSITFTWGENTYTIYSDEPVVVVFDANPNPPEVGNIASDGSILSANQVIEKQEGWLGTHDTTGPENNSKLYVHMEGRDRHLVYVAGSNFDTVSARNLPNWLLAETYRALYLMILVMENGGKPENGMMREGEGTLSPHTKEFDFGSIESGKQALVLVGE